MHKITTENSVWLRNKIISRDTLYDFLSLCSVPFSTAGGWSTCTGLLCSLAPHWVKPTGAQAEEERPGAEKAGHLFPGLTDFRVTAGWPQPFPTGSCQGLLHVTIFPGLLPVLHNPFLVSLNLDNPFNNLPSIILLSVHLFPIGNLTDRAASPSSHKRHSHSRN